MTLAYQSGFGNEFATEALPGALPVGRNSPQRCASKPAACRCASGARIWVPMMT